MHTCNIMTLRIEDLGSVIFGAIHTGRSRRPCHGGHQRPGPPTLQTIASRAEGTQGQRPPAAVLTQLPAWRTPLRKTGVKLKTKNIR